MADEATIEGLQAALADERRKRQAAETAHKAAEARIAEATKRATDAETALGEHRAQAEQSEILGALGLPADDPRVAEVLPMLRWHHEQLQVEEGKERPALTAHVRGLVESGHYLVAGLKPAATETKAAAKTIATTQAKPPPRTVGVTQPAGAAQPTPEQVAAMKPADLQAWLAGQDAAGASILDLVRG